MLDLDQVFYPGGIVSEEDKQKLRAHEAWPIVLALHFNTNQKIFVTEVGPEIRMRTLEGGMVLKIDGHIAISLGANDFNVQCNKAIIKSINVKYILNHIKRSTDVWARIMARIAHLDVSLIKSRVSAFLDNYKASYKPRDEFSDYTGYVKSDSDYADLLRAYFTRVNPPGMNLSSLKEKFVKLDAWDKKELVYNQGFQEFFHNKNKYLIIKGDGCYVAGKFGFYKGQFYKKDFMIYKSVDDLPEQCQGALAWWKILREGRKDVSYNYDQLDTYRFFPLGIFDQDAGGMNLHTATNQNWILDIPGDTDEIGGSIQTDIRGGPGDQAVEGRASEGETGDSEVAF